jgi:hypothetical protein
MLSRTVSACGNHHARKCSAPGASSGMSATASSNGTERWCSCSRNAGTTSSVALRISPVAPSPHSDAANSSGSSAREHGTTRPSGSISSSASTCVDMTPSASPEPCVAVAITPASVCVPGVSAGGAERGKGEAHLLRDGAAVAHAEPVCRELRLEVGEDDPALRDDAPFLIVDLRRLCQRPETPAPSPGRWA